ncbi:hypothetical protein H7U19_15925 [Hyunsoonleella sp. SJ7]|uniref:Transporter n=1 Tax=Hyunsoonleella aquatilis TaxID=2762758 RepID=A0A923H9P2_9FLAO|nr:transporter [Hyunsoonleella aquatilis]MBC3759901.1 hypothetical protein [Hyunsoonleella aquatilis]
MRTYLAFLFLISAQIINAQSGWTLKKGKAYTQIAFTTIPSYSEIFANPEYLTEREIVDNTLQFYAEYGLTDKTTIILNLPLKFIKTDGLVGNSSGVTNADASSKLGNVEIGLKQQFYNKKWVIAGQLNVEANTGSFDNTSGIRTGYDAWTFTPTLNASRSFDGFYVQGFTGLNLRTNGYSSNFKIGGEIGAKPWEKILLIAFLDIVESFRNGNINLPVSNQLTALYVNNQEYTTYGLKIIGEITDAFGINAGFGGAFSGNNVAKSPALTLGLYHKF